MRHPIPVVTGPTAAGKTALVTALAAIADIEIVSADSRQVYRGLDVGTAKPRGAERSAAPYHGLDVVEPAERYSAGRFARDAAGWISSIAARGRLPVVVGGTGFYLRALFEGLFDEPVPDAGRRERLRGALAGRGAGELARWAARLDPGFRGGGSQRAARAIEVALLTGTPLSVLQRRAGHSVPVVRPWFATIELPRQLLHARIAERSARMVRDGIVEEAGRALGTGATVRSPGLTGLGYREAVAVLEGRMAVERLPEVIAAATRRYARRQLTWFRHQLRGPVAGLDGTRAAGTLAKELLAGYRAACG